MQNEWLENLKVGDKVAIEFYNMGKTWYRISAVEKITETGRIKVKDIDRHFIDGQITRDCGVHTTLVQITDDILLNIEKRKIIVKINKLDFEKLPIEKLRQINKIISEDNLKME